LPVCFGPAITILSMATVHVFLQTPTNAKNDHVILGESFTAIVTKQTTTYAMTTGAYRIRVFNEDLYASLCEPLSLSQPSPASSSVKESAQHGFSHSTVLLPRVYSVVIKLYSLRQ